MTLIVKRLVRKLPILLGIIFVLVFATSIKDDFIGHIGKAEVNLTNITMNNSGLSGSNTTQINMNTPFNNSIKHVIIIVMENKGYIEDMPQVCHLKDSGGSGYIAHHNPFVYFDLRNDDSCKNTVGLDEFYKDLSNQTIPNYSFIVPNNIHNTHDSTVTEGDNWLSNFVPKIINSSKFNNTALFIVYDEGKKNDKSGFGSGIYAVNGGQLPLLLVSPLANKGFVSSLEYTHYNLLTTVEKILNLGNLGKGDTAAKPMAD